MLFSLSHSYLLVSSDAMALASRAVPAAIAAAQAVKLSYGESASMAESFDDIDAIETCPLMGPQSMWMRITQDVGNDIATAVNHSLASAEIVDVPNEGTLQEKLAAMTSAMAALSFRWRGVAA